MDTSVKISNDLRHFISLRKDCHCYLGDRGAEVLSEEKDLLFTAAVRCGDRGDVGEGSIQEKM